MAVFRVRTLPAVLEPKSWYLVRPEGSETVQLYVTGANGGPAVPVGTDAPEPDDVDPGDLILYFENGLT